MYMDYKDTQIHILSYIHRETYICLVWYSRQAPEVIGRDLLHISRERRYFMNNKEV